MHEEHCQSININSGKSFLCTCVVGDGETGAAEESCGGTRQRRFSGGGGRKGALAKLALRCFKVGRTFRVGGGCVAVKAGDRTGSSSSRLRGTVPLAYPTSLPKQVTKRDGRTTTSITAGGRGILRLF